jgi:hypothetical protein
MASHLPRAVLGAGLAAAVMLGAPVTAGAQRAPGAPAPSDAKRRAAAKKLVDDAIAAQNAGDYDKAIALYQRAFALIPHPDLLFNVGQAYRLAGQPRKAARFYTRYLQLAPDGKEAATARAHLAAIRGSDDAGDPPEDEPSGATDAPREEPAEADEPRREPDRPEVAAKDKVSAARTTSASSPGERAVAAVAGLSFTARWMTLRPVDGSQPSFGYSQSVPAAGVYVDATVFPLAVGHRRTDWLRHLGAAVMLDRVLSLETRNVTDGNLTSVDEQRYAIGVAFRYPLGPEATAPVVGAALRYGGQQFTTGGATATPDVDYRLIDLAMSFHYPVGPRLVLNLRAGALVPTDAGPITKVTAYGRASVRGFEGSVGVDYLLTEHVFLRAEARLETFGYSFLGDGMKLPAVEGARDTYSGGILTIGYLL